MLGTGSVNPRTDVEADGSVTLAGRDVTVGSQGDIVSDHFGHNTGGSVRLRPLVETSASADSPP